MKMMKLYTVTCDGVPTTIRPVNKKRRARHTHAMGGRRRADATSKERQKKITEEAVVYNNNTEREREQVNSHRK
jgi:hypothetical protein